MTNDEWHERGCSPLCIYFVMGQPAATMPL